VGYRILYHHRTQALDGQRVHINAIQQALREQGHEVLEVSPLPAVESAGGRAVPTWRRRVLQSVAGLTPKGAYEALELSYNLVGYRALRAAIRSFKPSFIYERYALNTVAGVWASQRTGVPLLLEVNSPLAEEKSRLKQLLFHGVALRLERYALRRATGVLAVTDVLADMLRASAGLRNGRVVTVHNGVDPDEIARRESERAAARADLGCGDDAVVVGAVGFFREWHGIDVALKAFADLQGGAPHTTVVLVGDGPAVPGLQRLTNDLGLAGSVKFTGAVPHERVARHLSAMDAVIIPRAVEYASPLKLFEYMAGGKAIIAPRQPNLLEVITDGHDALCFDPDDVAGFRGALARVVRDAELRARLGAAARATIAAKRLTWSGNAARITQTFERLTRGRKGGDRS
jgi:glycosyltransferase involved in cell wall biosynthesis